MLVYCSNCNTPHTISHEELRRLREPVINCSGCDKKIKMQFCPGCGAFYSVTFSNIKPGNYRYRCRKCSLNFLITIPAGYPGTVKENKPSVKNSSLADAPLPGTTAMINRAGTFTSREESLTDGITLRRNSISTFAINELFSLTATSFSIKKILPASLSVLIMIMLVHLFTMLQGIAAPVHADGQGKFFILFTLIPAALLISFYMAAASVISKVTLKKIFYNSEPSWNSIAVFAMTKSPVILLCNTAAILLLNLGLVLFGKIPMIGPLLFAVAFLPVYVLSTCIALLVVAGIWFYPPLTAHRGKGMFSNLKDFLLFMKKHNLTLLYMVPAAAMIALTVFAVIFAIHSLALTLTITLLKVLPGADASAIFSGIPALLIKTSEFSFSGINASIFRELSSDISVIQRVAGFVIGASMTVITVLLISLFFSITATISTHIYIMMERGITLDDRRKALTMFILILFLTSLIMLRRIF